MEMFNENWKKKTQHIITLRDSLCSIKSANAEHLDKFEILNLQFDRTITDKKNHINENCDVNVPNIWMNRLV